MIAWFSLYDNQIKNLVKEPIRSVVGYRAGVSAHTQNYRREINIDMYNTVDRFVKNKIKIGSYNLMFKHTYSILIHNNYIL